MRYSPHAAPPNMLSMKKLFETLLLCVITMTLFLSCHPDGKENTTPAQEEYNTKDNDHPCCEVVCRRGACRTYESPCQCLCEAGQPICHGLNQGGDDPKGSHIPKIIVKATPGMMSLYDEDIQYIEQTLHHTAAAQALRNIKQLLIDNQYVLSSESAIQAYLENAAVYVEFANIQPDSVIDRLSELDINALDSLLIN